ncbi:MAG: spermidine synthase [Hyphomicrobiaceae bacterium]
MSMSDGLGAVPGKLGAWRERLVLPVFVVTIFLSAFLLFAVQPMFAKMVTPKLGGTPAVWSVAMVFFQAVLLAGYGFAHALNRTLTPRQAVLTHVGVCAVVALVGLPIAFDQTLGAPPSQGQAFWLIGVFALSVGLPFFSVSANGPLLQAWFSRSGHAHAGDPYFLYGASNLGSFAALLAYPFVIEPWLALKTQSTLWGVGFVLLAVSIAASGFVAMSGSAAAGACLKPSQAREVGAAIGWQKRLAWIALAFVPSALLVAVTAHISTDIATVPLLWVLPLALFLLTFVLAFSSRGERLHVKLLALQPAVLAVLVAIVVLPRIAPLGVVLAAHLGFFFVSAMICHGELYRRRPQASRLTEFYLYVSLGGVLGGVFASLLAPAIFNDILEYPLLIIAAALARPGLLAEVRRVGFARVAIIAGAVALAFVALQAGRVVLPMLVGLGALLVLAGTIVISREAPLRLVAATVLAVLLQQLGMNGSEIVSRTRSFFAVHTVRQTEDGRARYLVHGSTVHGAEWVRTADGSPVKSRPEPASYFYRGGPYAAAIEAARQVHGGKLGRVAVVGLGMGSLACHARSGEGWEFFEIDPEVVRIARDRSVFRSFTACAPGAPVVLGDGRLTLAEAKPGYDLIILDAFSSDAVPVHLLTAEALAMYAAKLSPKGAIVFNITNRHMLLDQVVAGAAGAAGLMAWHKRDQAVLPPFAASLQARAHVAIAARRPEHVGRISADTSWSKAEAGPAGRVWTDDYSNIMDPVRRKLGW